MRDQYMRTGQGFLLIYSITSKGTFDEAKTFYDQILRVKDSDYIPLILCGNKCDLENERQVSRVEGEDLAKSFKAPFFEASAKNRLNVDELFFNLVKEIRKYNLTIQPIENKKKFKCVIL